MVDIVVLVFIGATLLVFGDRRVVPVSLTRATASIVAVLTSRSVGLLGLEAVGYGRPEREASALEVSALVVSAASLLPVTTTAEPRRR